MKPLPFSLYDAFTDRAFGGSQAAIIFNAAWIDSDTRLTIARELNFPATCFVTNYSNRSVTVRFQSTEKDYPMCGHGTICLMTHMLEKDILTWQEGGRIDVQLFVGSANTMVEMYKREDGRPIVMLDIQPPSFQSVTLDTKNLVTFLGAKTDQFHMELPIELAIGDFTHLVVPISDLDAMRRIRPDFFGLKQFCLDHSFDTVVVFCREVVQSGYDVHLRDFCPAVGVAESAASGTTNAALTSYLIRHKLIRAESAKQLIIVAEQGLEINRPSSIQSIVTLNDGTITRLQVGGVAAKVLEGKLYIADVNSEDICKETETN